MFVRVVPLSQPSSKGLLYVKCLCELSRYHSPVDRGLLYVKCLCELSRYHSPVVEVCYMLNVYVSELSRYSTAQWNVYVKCLCELSRYHSPVLMLNVCVSCPVITAQ